MAMTASAFMTTSELRVKPRPVAMGRSTQGLASDGEQPGTIPTVNPPSSRAPRQAASMTPPRPPQTTTAPARAMCRPTSKADSTAWRPGRLPPMTATRILWRMSFMGVLPGISGRILSHSDPASADLMAAGRWGIISARFERPMPFINYAAKSIAIKIVYYGPGLSGKTTNLRYIYLKLDSASRGELVSLQTETDRTFFFDLLPIKAGTIGDYKVHFQLMTAPGQVFYEASRQSILRGVDGLVFVADSQIPLLDANLESFDGLRRNCLQNDVDLLKVPLVFQYNKRDLSYLIPVETFNNLLNPRRSPWVEA